MSEQSIYYTSRGKKVHALHWSFGQEGSIIFIHGAIANAYWWRWVSMGLGQGQLYSVDLSGHGLSEWDAPYFLSHHVENVLDLITSQDLKPPYYLIGHSYGGLVAIAALHQLQQAQAVMVDTPMYLLNEAYQSSKRRYMKPTYATLDEAVSRFRPLPNQPVTNAEYLSWLARHSVKKIQGGYTWQFDPGFHQRVISLEDQQLIHQLCKGQFYWYGEYSPFATEHGLSVASEAGMNLSCIPEAYHAVPVDNPDYVVKLIRKLMSSQRLKEN
ncbi:alpha/beta hydrolase [Candidatus Comchoanobacter bicostacola]|uniref:Alpha/beta hydrolase n=1 Tax=Candidatus Comchoanobacter bicostacola TaxID=2919598 RepID=A0ABY5DN84_9GAMM|nr:alpha/beta hydrolase [Candidatus Comchoanobacter bicostacola]UTC24919.1 alpha/beta hydrolase [Candidatus Comchoanobacter bicostacola]